METCGLDVYWNLELIFSITGTEIGDYEIYSQSFIVNGVEGENYLSLVGTGTVDDSGMTMDNVLLYGADDGNRE